jgi:hypothetical protein
MTATAAVLQVAVLGAYHAAVQPTVASPRVSPVAHLRRRRESRTPLPPPFSVESVNRWGDEQRIVIRADKHRFELKPGERYGGWMIESTDGQAVTLLDRKGRRQRVNATWH